MDNVANDIKASGDNLLFTANNYVANCEKYNQRHISFIDLPKITKAYVFGGLLLTLAAGLGIGVIGQEKLTVYDPSDGWNTYVINNHLKRIQGCWTQAKETGKSTNCNVVVKP